MTTRNGDGPPLRVLWLVDSMKRAREDAQIAAFIKAADPKRLKVDLLVLSPRFDPRFRTDLERQGTRIHFANALNRRDVGAFLRVRRFIREGRYDLVHAHTSWAALVGSAAGRLLKVPVVATLYDARIDRTGEADLLKEEARAIRALRRWGARVVALSGAQWDRYVQGGAFSRSFLEVIYQGVETRDAPFQHEEREAAQIWLRRYAEFPAGSQVAVTIADLDDWESGVDVLLWALPAIIESGPQVRLVVVGEGEHRSELERRVRARGLNKRVSWHDTDDEITRILAGSDLFVHPSLRDPFPVAALRAMAAGLPVVGTRVGGVPEIIGSSDVGRLVPRSDPDALARAVVEMFSDPVKLGVMGRAAADRVGKLFPVSGWVDRQERLYREVMEDARAGRVSKPKSYARLDVELLGLNGAGLTQSSPSALVSTG